MGLVGNLRVFEKHIGIVGQPLHQPLGQRIGSVVTLRRIEELVRVASAPRCFASSASARSDAMSASANSPRFIW